MRVLCMYTGVDSMPCFLASMCVQTSVLDMYYPTLNHDTCSVFENPNKLYLIVLTNITRLPSKIPLSCKYMRE